MTKSSSSLAGLSGLVLAEKYRLQSLLGSGGMGVVYLAEQLELGRSVAIKILRSELVQSRFDWFRAEALAASRINHPHAVAIYDFGVTEDGTPYLVMEHLRGKPLSQLLEDQHLPFERVVRIGCQILSALDEAHACGVIHCDLTSDNVIVERLRDGDDFAKVIDFGLARLLGDGDGARQLVGTAEYVAPEQIKGETTTAQVDLYAMGILLYEMIVGRTPFAGASEPVILDGHLNAQPDAPHHVIPSCPSALGELVLRALSKSPADRPSSAAEMRDLLVAMFPEVADATTHSRPAAASRPPGDGSESYRARRRASRLTAPLVKLESRLVGRERELDRVLAFCREPSSSATLIIEGARGLGKARLTSEASERCRKRITFFSGAADPSGHKLSWYPILLVLEQILEVSSACTYAELTRAVARCGLPERDVPGLAEIFGLDGPAAKLELAVRRREASACALHVLQAGARMHGDVVFCFADVDRYDQPSLRMLESLAGKGAGGKVLLTAETLPPSLAIALVASERLTLEGLTPDAARELASLLAAPHLRVPDAATVHALTGGSPAAVEQLAGWIELGHGTADVPSLLVDLVSVRIHRLPAPARRTLQSVAIHGSVAPRRVVDASVGADEQRALREHTWTGLLVVGDETLTIPTDLVASVISACTPADVRRRLHRRAFEAYAGLGPAGVRGHHAELCGETAWALDLFIEAGHECVRCFDDPGAAVWYGRAVACARAMTANAVEGARTKLCDASVLLAEVLRQAGELRLAKGVCEEAQRIDPDARQRAMIHRTLGTIAHSAEQYERAIEHLELAIGDALKAGEREFLCQCYLDLVRAFEASGRPDRATRELVEAIDVITLGDGLHSTSAPSRLWRMGMVLAERYLAAGDVGKARSTAQSALALATREANPHAAGRISALLAKICDAAGEPGAALRHRTNAIDAMRTLGDRRSTAELLIATAGSDLGGRAQPALAQDRKASLRLAARLAEEIGWTEGLALTSSMASG